MNKNNFIQRINNSFVKFSEWVLDHRLLVLTGCLILCIGGIALSSKMHIDFTPKFWLPDDDPSYDYYMNNFIKEYGNDEFIYILYKTRQGVFDLDALKKTRRLVEDLKGIPYIKKVHSITNLEFMEGTPEGDLRVYNIMDEFPTSQPGVDRLKRKLMDKPVYVGSYISKDADYAAILCEIKVIPEDVLFYHEEIGDNLKRVLQKQDYRDFEFYPAGSTVYGITLWNLFKENMVNLPLPAFILIISFLILLFRQFKGIVSPLIVIQITSIMVIGFMAISGFPITTTFSMILAVLMAVGIADAVHIISEYQIHLKAGFDNRTSIIKAVKLLGFPCLFTSITTVIGFSSLSIASISPVREMGLSVAFGVLAAFAVTFTIQLVVLSLAGERTERKFKKAEVKKNHGFMDRTLLSIAHLNNRYYKKVLLISAIVSIILVYGITRVEVNTSMLMLFGNRVKTTSDFKFVDEIMGGTSNFEILLDSKKAEGVKTLRFVQILEKIQNFANSQDYLVNKTVSVVDMVKDVNRALNNNDKSFYRVPSSYGEELQNVNEFIYELYGGEELEKFVSADHRTARLTIYTKSTDSKIYDRFHDDLVEFIESIELADYTYNITGLSFLAIKMYHNMTETMIKSLSLVIVLISIMMIFIFRSFKIGLISMVPNVFPILFGLGYMGLSGIYLSQVTSTIGCIIIGLAVDDTIHFISRYRMEFARLGNYKKALDASMVGIGRALTITTIILFIGFGATMISKMDLYYYFGLLASICLVVALLADFFIAPALILFFKPFGKEFTPEEEVKSF